MKFREDTGYSFDDVLLVPQHSIIESREDVNLNTRLGSLSLNFPVLSANMDTVTGPEMAIAMGKYGGAGVLHRFGDTLEMIRQLHNKHIPVIISVGVNDNDTILADITTMIECDYRLDAVCVDIAHGDSAKAISTTAALREEFPNLDIIAGNVATGDGALRLFRAGANIIKVGIGPGSVCSTRVVSGHGVPQLSAILDVSDELSNWRVYGEEQVFIIADGGIRYPGDVVKALAAGADAVMLGSMLAGTEESPGYVFVEDKHAYKSYRGSASHAAQGNSKSARVEGVSARIPFRGKVEWTLNNIRDGLRSGFSYSGAANLQELQQKAEFQVVTSNTIRESHPHHPYLL